MHFKDDVWELHKSAPHSHILLNSFVFHENILFITFIKNCVAVRHETNSTPLSGSEKNTLGAKQIPRPLKSPPPQRVLYSHRTWIKTSQQLFHNINQYWHVFHPYVARSFIVPRSYFTPYLLVMHATLFILPYIELFTFKLQRICLNLVINIQSAQIWKCFNFSN